LTQSLASPAAAAAAPLPSGDGQKRLHAGSAR